MPPAGTGADEDLFEMVAGPLAQPHTPGVRLPDGSYRSCLDGLTVRIIDADLTMTGYDGSHVRDRYRLITTLPDHRCFPAADLLELYHQRWEIKSAYLALRHTDSGRSQTCKKLAQQLQVKPRNLLTPLAEWTRLGFLFRTDAAT